MGSGFKPNRRGLDQLQRELQRELDKRPVYVRAQAEAGGVLPAAATVNNYHGPVVTVNGNNAQLAWDNQSVDQTQDNDIASGFETLAEVLTGLLASMPSLGLSAEDEAAARDNANVVLGEVVKGEPDNGVVKRGVTMLKGLLAPVAAGLATAVTSESADLAKTVIEGLGDSLPF